MYSFYKKSLFKQNINYEDTISIQLLQAPNIIIVLNCFVTITIKI